MWFNSIMTWLLNSRLHGLLSNVMMLIRFRGRRSGKEYRIPVNYLQTGDLLLTTSFKERTWWRNLRGGAEVTVCLRGQERSAFSEVVESQEEVAAKLEMFIAKSARSARFLGIELDAAGKPTRDSLLKAAQSRVVISTRLR